jgi:pyruvate/2-oxoglutarate dehydrogenase complex dihydrolipoamide dehydrogenase (E3) component
VHFEKP